MWPKTKPFAAGREAPASAPIAPAPRAGAPDDRLAAARLGAALGHALRLLRLASASTPGPGAGPELRAIEDALGRAALADEYVAVAAQVLALKASKGVDAATGIGAPLFRKLADAKDALARALDLPDLARELRDRALALSSTDASVDPEPLLRFLRRATHAVGATREASEALEHCLRDVEEGIGALSREECEHEARLGAARARIQAAQEIAELEAMRAKLLEEVEALAVIAAERGTLLDRLRRRSKAAQLRAERLLAALSDATAAARTDPLTGLGNRRALGDAVVRASVSAASTGVLAIDLDHFKRINDVHGHAIGDRALVTVAEVLRGELRGDDAAFRVGGEEIVVLLARCDRRAALATAERLRARIAEEPTPVPSGRLRITASIGVAVWRGGSSFDDALEAADAALYRAKREGRDRVCGE